MSKNLITNAGCGLENKLMRFEQWGCVEYGAALQKQIEYVEQLASGQRDEVVVLCCHPKVVTLGRSSEAHDLCGWTGPVHAVGRGGRATYHGPEQIVIYPILNLKRVHKNIARQDVRQFLRQLEKALVGALGEFVRKATETTQTSDACSSLLRRHHRGGATEIAQASDACVRSAGADVRGESHGHPLEFFAHQTGVWACPSGDGTLEGGAKKIVSIGVGVKRWCTYHGAAIHFQHSPHAFRGLKPCGLDVSHMSSLEQLMPAPLLHRESLIKILQKHLSLCLS